MYKVVEGCPAYNSGKIAVGDKLLEVWLYKDVTIYIIVFVGTVQYTRP